MTLCELFIILFDWVVHNKVIRNDVNCNKYYILWFIKAINGFLDEKIYTIQNQASVYDIIILDHHFNLIFAEYLKYFGAPGHVVDIMLRENAHKIWQLNIYVVIW